MARWGLEFLLEADQLAKKLVEQAAAASREQPQPDIYIQLLSYPYLGKPVMLAAPAQFGRLLEDYSVEAEVAFSVPFSGCSSLLNGPQVKGKVVAVQRGDCMFQDKARNVQEAGAVGVIVIDNKPGTSAETSQPFAMSGDIEKEDDIKIPAVFLFRREGNMLMNRRGKTATFVRITMKPYDEDSVVESFMRWGPGIGTRMFFPKCGLDDGYFIRIEPPGDAIAFQFRFGGVTQDSDPLEHQGITERHIGNLADLMEFSSPQNEQDFLNFVRNTAYTALGLSVKDEPLAPVLKLLKDVKLQREHPDLYRLLPGELTRVRCQPAGEVMACAVVL